MRILRGAAPEELANELFDSRPQIQVPHWTLAVTLAGPFSVNAQVFTF